MKKILSLSFLTILIISLSSCLKDELVESQKYGMINLNTNKIIGFNDLKTAFAMPFEDVEKVIELPVHLSSEVVANEDIRVSLSLANSANLITDYNVKNNTDYEPFPSSLYTIIGNGLEVTIPKGSRDGSLKFKVNTSHFDPSTIYALGLTINTVDKNGYIISGNFKNTIVTFGAKNKYDGVYTLKCKMSGTDRPTVNTTSEWSWGGEIHLVTIGANTVVLFDDWGFGQNIQPMQTSTGGYSGFGSTEPAFTIDPVTNKVTSVVNLFSNNTGARTFTLDTNEDSHYDPVTKTIVVNYIMNQSGFLPLKIKDTFKYVGER